MPKLTDTQIAAVLKEMKVYLAEKSK